MLNEDYKDMLQCLLEEKVRFLLVGAYAVAVHGYPRATKDMDVFVRAAPDNASNLMRAQGRCFDRGSASAGHFPGRSDRKQACERSYSGSGGRGKARSAQTKIGTSSRDDLHRGSLKNGGLRHRHPLHFGPYCISPLPKDQSSRPVSTRLIHTSSFRTPAFAWISSAM
jgi:hypothetical protein